MGQPEKTQQQPTAKPPGADQMSDAERDELMAKFTFSPAANASAVVQMYGTQFAGKQNLVPLAQELKKSIASVKNGNLSDAEAMLVSQAHALQSIFAAFSVRALNQEYQSNLESFFRMAMKAQNQCRMTLETLANIKNPPVVIARQANIAHGHQQVNYGMPAPAPAEEKAIQSNELLEDKPHGQRLDLGTPGTAARINPEMATVEAVDRPTNAKGQSRGR